MSTVFNELLQRGDSELSTSVLKSVKIDGTLRGLACELTVTQTFHNPGKKNIEAVYTFPLPHKAVLLDLSAKVGERELRGSVLPKAKAEERYENAVSEGNGAIMLERTDDGICTVNFGNLMPGETASLEYRYAYLLDWQQNTVRFQLPTTIAPRYGDPIAAGYQPHQVPATDFLAEYPFSLKLKVEGVLADAMFDSPSHGVDILKKDGHVEISLRNKQAWMDRDFILNMKHSTSDRADGRIGMDPVSDGQVALASFCPQFPGKGFDSICAKIVVDCSGSMNGSSIEQARAGLHRILDNLRESDTFNVIRFGSNHRAYFASPVPAKGRNLRNARGQIDNLQADLGGTEMESALDFTYSLEDDGSRPSVILLITDGEISNHRDVIRKAVKSGHRIFTVGVGSSVAEALVKDLASKTGGACELVSPNEGMAEAIYRQFQRMMQPRASKVSVSWPGTLAWQSPAEIGPIFAGDTLHIFAGLEDCEGGKAKLILETEDGSRIEQNVSLTGSSEVWDALPRIAAASRIVDLDKDRPALAEELSNIYQLVTRHTNYLILDEKAEEEKSEDLPELVKVSQMLAAGWGGTGRPKMVVNKDWQQVLARTGRPGVASDASPMILCSGRRQQADSLRSTGPDSIDIPAFLRKQIDDTAPENRMKFRRNSVNDLDELDGYAPQWLMDKEEALAATDLRVEMRHHIKEVIAAGGGWFGIYTDRIFQKLPVKLRAVLRSLTKDEGWAETTAGASLILALMRKLSMDDELAKFTPTLEAAGDRYLVRLFEDGVVLDQYIFEWQSHYELLPSVSV